MGIVYLALGLSFAVLLVVNITFVAVNLYFWATHGLQALLQGMNFVQRIEYSIYLKWILLADGIWLASALVFASRRKHYKTDPSLHYLTYKPITNPRVCVVVPTYNEEPVIERIVKDFASQPHVIEVLVVDNHSTDRTADIAELCGAKVIRKPVNKGITDSLVLGMKESLKTDANIIALTEADGTYSGHDLGKMIPYLDNTDMVIGTRQIQVLLEKGNQNKMFYVWGNFFLAKLIQIKFFSLLHMGVVNLTDVGCTYRCIRRDALEKIIDQFTYPGTDKLVFSSTSGIIGMFLVMIGIKNDLRIVEVPITFRKRVGASKTEVDKKSKAVVYGLKFLWYILAS